MWTYAFFINDDHEEIPVPYLSRYIIETLFAHTPLVQQGLIHLCYTKAITSNALRLYILNSALGFRQSLGFERLGGEGLGGDCFACRLAGTPTSLPVFLFHISPTSLAARVPQFQAAALSRLGSWLLPERSVKTTI